MSEELALEALRTGDFTTAASLLEAVVRETGFSSDIVNNAYTLALHHLGDNARLATVAYKIGLKLADSDPAAAMDYFQRALFAGLNGSSSRQIGEVLEKWSGPRKPQIVKGALKKVAHVVGSLSPGDPVSSYVKVVCSSLSERGIQSFVFTTESAAAWFWRSAPTPLSRDLGLSNTTIASVAGDFLTRAEAVAAAVRASGAVAAFYHGDLSEQITARVAAFRPTPVQINVNHRAEMAADLFEARIHLSKAALDRSVYRNKPTALIPPASDIETRLRAIQPATRQSLGIPSECSISATFGDLQQIASPGFVRVLAQLLRRFPAHFHLFVGAGDVKGIRGPLHAEGVLPRVRFLGHMSDAAPLLPVIDVYLASFPNCEVSSLLDAMGAAKPVVALRSFSPSQDASGADLVGIQELIAPGEANYIELADRLIRDRAVRAKQSDAVRERFLSQFHPTKLADQYVEFLNAVASI